MSACEWNPTTNGLALNTDPSHGDSVWSVGRGKRNIHLCDSCRNLKRFSRMKAKPLNGGAADPIIVHFWSKEAEEEEEPVCFLKGCTGHVVYEGPTGVALCQAHLDEAKAEAGVQP